MSLEARRCFLINITDITLLHGGHCNIRQRAQRLTKPPLKTSAFYSLSVLFCVCYSSGSFYAFFVIADVFCQTVYCVSVHLLRASSLNSHFCFYFVPCVLLQAVSIFYPNSLTRGLFSLCQAVINLLLIDLLG